MTSDRRRAVHLAVGSGALLVYVFAGYPLVAGLLARARPRPIAPDSSFTPRVSVVIAALDEARAIDRKLESVGASEYPRDLVETIVVADGSSDETAQIAARHDGVVVLDDAVRRGKSAALMRGVGVARGDVVVFTDANNLLRADALRELVAPLADPTVGCVTGRKSIDDGSRRSLDVTENLYWRYESRIRSWENRWGSVSSVNGELLAFRRSAVAQLGASTVNDDFTLAMEAAIAGWRIAYAERAVSLEPASATTAGESARRERIVAGRWVALRHVGTRLARRNPVLAWQVLSHKGLRLIVPAATVGLALGNLAAFDRRRWTKPLLVAQAAFYAAATVGWHFERRRRRVLATYVPFYFVRMNMATIAGLVRSLGRRDGLVRWQRVERRDEA